MAETFPFRNLVSHRVTLDYDGGTRIVGYLASCKPAAGRVQVLLLQRAEILDAGGQILETMKELAIVPDTFLNLRVTEGPGGF